MSGKLRKVLAGGLCLGLVLSALGGCRKEGLPSAATQGVDVLTQKVIEEGRTPITVLVKHAYSAGAFEQAVEEKFSDIDIILVGNYAYDRGVTEYQRRMEHDDLTDIVMTWPLDVGEEYWDDRLLDLSGMPFTGCYNTSMLDTISRGGKLYYLPGPAQVRGVIYNKTLFEEKGWEVPHDFEGFVALCQTIEESGMRSIQLGFKNGEVLDTAFTGWSYGACYGTPADAQWISDYNAGKGSFGDHFGPALDTFQAMIDAGIWKADDLNVNYPLRENMLFSRQCAMVEDSVLMAGMGEVRTGTTDEFALMPFFSPGEKGDWARLYMVCYVGINKHLAEPQNRERYEKVLEVMEYISSAEGQAAMIDGNGTMYSSVKGVPAADVPEIAPLHQTLGEGRSAIFEELKNAQGALREGLAGMLTGELTREDVIRMVDEQNQNPPQVAPTPVLGTATTDFSMTETGNFITDVMRATAGSDFALFLDNGKDGRTNGKGLNGRFYQGELFEEDIVRVMPDGRQGEKKVLEVVSMTGENLMQTLEHSISVDAGNTGWFYYFSGLKMTFAPAGVPGERVKSIATAAGDPIEPEKVYTVAVLDGSYPQEYAISVTATGHSAQSLLIETIVRREIISPAADGRFTIAEP